MNKSFLFDNMMNLNRITLSFTDESEKEYKRYFFQNSLFQLRASFILLIFLYSIFGILDLIIDKEQSYILLFIRFFVVVPFMLMTFVMSFFEIFKKIWQHLLLLSFIVSGIGISMMTFFMHVNNNYFSGILVVFIAGYLLIKLRFIYASLAGFINILFYNVGTILFTESDLSSIVSSNFFLISANLIGMASAYYFEYYHRRDYFLNNILKNQSNEIKDLNQNFKQKVEEKTKGIQENLDELAIEKEYYEFIFNSSPDAVFIIEFKSGKIRDVNFGFENMMLYSRDEVVEKSSIELGLWKELQNRQAFLNLLEIKNNCDNFETEFLRKNNSSFFANISAKILEINHVKCIFAIVRDVSDIKEKDKMLIESLDKYKFLVDNMVDVVWMLDSDFKCKYVSPSFQTVLGYSIEELFELNVFDLLSDDSKKYIFEQIKEYFDFEHFDAQIQKKIEIEVIHKNGSMLTLENRVGVIFNNNNQVEGIFGVSYDITDRKVALNELSKSEEKFRLIAENTSDCITLFDLNLVQTYVSPSILNIRGFTAEEAIHHKIEDIVAPESLSLVLDTFSNFMLIENIEPLNKDRIEILEIQIKHKNGLNVWVEVSASLIRNENNKPLNIITVTRDIADRKKILQELKDSNRIYKLVAEKITDVVWLLDLNLKSIFVSPSIERFTGFSIPEYLTQTLSDRFTLESENFAKEMFSNELRKFKEMPETLEAYSKRIKLEYKCKNGGTKWGELIITPLFNDQDNLVGIHGVTRDITDIEKAFVQLSYKNRVLNEINRYAQDISLINYEKIFEFAVEKLINLSKSSLVILSIYDKETKEFVLKRSSFSNIEVQMVSQILGISVNDFRMPVSDEYYQKFINEVVFESESLTKVSFGNIPESTSVLIDQNSDYNWFQAIPLVLNNELFGSIFISWKKGVERIQSEELLTFTSITANAISRFMAEDSLFKAKIQAEESDRLKSAFLANISHEIRTPMNGILGFTDLLKNLNLNVVEQKEYIEIIHQSGKRMLDILNDIVDVSKIESGQVDTHTSFFCLNDLLRELFAFFNPKASNLQLDLIMEFDCPDEESWIETDRTKLHQIITNLVNNAFKFTKKGYIKFGYKTDGNNVVFYVEDSGVGIPSDKISDVFKRFVQVENSSDIKSGAGLGLSISKAYIELLGGEIWVDSVYDKGTVFYFKILFKKQSLPEKSIKNVNTFDLPIHKINILIAEDDQVCMLLLKKILNHENIVLYCASNGYEAVEIVKKEKNLNIALLDIKMPIMDGIQATKLIKEINPDLPIIIQSAFAFSSDKILATEAGCNEFLTKPIQKEQLFRLINKFIVKED